MTNTTVMNLQAIPIQSPTLAEHRPKGKLVIPSSETKKKEYPKEKFYSFLKTGVDKFLNAQFGEMDLNATRQNHNGGLQEDNDDYHPTQFDVHVSCGSLMESSSSFATISHLPKILEDESAHEPAVVGHKTVFPDISKFYADSDTSDDSDSELDSESSWLSLNDDDEEEEEEKKTTTLEDNARLGRGSSHSLYERRESSDEGSDWEVESDDDASVGLTLDEKEEEDEEALSC